MTAVSSTRSFRVPSAASLILLALMLPGGNALAQIQSRYISVSPTTLNFSVSEGQSQTLTLTISNISDKDVVLDVSLVTGHFSHGEPADNPLQAGNSTTLEVLFIGYPQLSVESGRLHIRADVDGVFVEEVPVDLYGTVSHDCSGMVATASGGGTITQGAVALLKGSGGAKCSWTPQMDLTDPSSCTTFAAPVTSTNYTLTVTDQYGFCSASKEVKVQVADLSSLLTGSVPPTGSLLYLVRGMPTPDGYEYLGQSTISYGSGKIKTTIQVDVYRKN